jgi:hypothetical protein
LFALPKRNREDAEPKMSRLSFVLLMVTSLVLTVYFGAAAWRLAAITVTSPASQFAATPDHTVEISPQSVFTYLQFLGMFSLAKETTQGVEPLLQR